MWSLLKISWDVDIHTTMIYMRYATITRDVETEYLFGKSSGSLLLRILYRSSDLTLFLLGKSVRERRQELSLQSIIRLKSPLRLKPRRGGLIFSLPRRISALTASLTRSGTLPMANIQAVLWTCPLHLSILVGREMQIRNCLDVERSELRRDPTSSTDTLRTSNLPSSRM